MLRSLASMAPSTAASTSASSKTMNAASPPSSSSGRTTRRAAPAMISRPTWVDPVNVTARTAGWSSSAWVTSRGGPCTRLTTPLGMPASVSVRIISVAASGAFSETLATTVHPAARAGASLRAWMEQGKFHGVSEATTPTGRLMLRCRRSAASCGRTSPCGRRVCSANQRRYSALKVTSPTASGSRLPASAASRRPIGSARSTSSRLASSSRSARCRAGRSDQSGKARAAASAARWAVLASA